MKRIVVRVWAGDAKTKSNPIAEATSFYGTALGQPGVSNIDWTVGTTAGPEPCGAQTGGVATGGIMGGGTVANGGLGANGAAGTPCVPPQNTPGVTPTLTAPTPTTGPGTLQ
jgi:hypothetical protein